MHALACIFTHSHLKKKKQWQAINILYFFCHLMTLSHLIHRIVCVCVCESFTHVQLFATPWTVACQAPLCMEFTR